MPLTDSDYNAFATRLADRFALRAKGLDEESARIVNLRPSDHILGGFLTPVSGTSATIVGVQPQSRNPAEDTDEILADDLPKDAAYEQTAIGMEWLSFANAFGERKELIVEAEFCVYIRRLPTLDEQKRYAVWRDVRNISHGSGTEPQDATQTRSAKEAGLVPVWTRERVANIRVVISLAKILRERCIREDLTSQIRTAARMISLEGAYPGRRPIAINQTTLDSPETFKASLNNIRTDSFAMSTACAGSDRRKALI